MRIGEIQLQELPGTHLLYLSPEWIDLYKGQVSVFGVFNSNEEIIGGFILQSVKMKGLNALINPLFVSNNCLYLKSPSDKVSRKISFEKKVFDAFAAFLSQRKERIIDFSFPSAFSDMQSLQWKGIEVKPRYTYKIDLTQSEDDLWANLDGSMRANIKKAKSDGLVSVNGTGEHLLKMTDHSFGRQEKSYHRELLSTIAHSNELAENRRIFVARKNDIDFAAVMIVFDNETSYYSIGGYDHKNNHRGAMALAMWDAILFAKSNGIGVFDFQGSMLQQVERFIRGFGGELHTYYRVSRIPFWVKIGAGLFGRKIDG